MFGRRTGGIVSVALAAGLMTAASAGAAQPVWPRLSVPLDASNSLSFAYPPQWTVLGSSLGSAFVTSHYALLAFVGSEHLHQPCLEAPNPCNPEAIDSLAPGHVYARWSDVAFAPTVGRATTTLNVGGRLGWMVSDPGGWCSRYGTAKTLRVFLLSTNTHGGLEFDACLRPPGLTAEQAIIERILHSTTFTTAR